MIGSVAFSRLSPHAIVLNGIIAVAGTPEGESLPFFLFMALLCGN